MLSNSESLSSERRAECYFNLEKWYCPNLIWASLVAQSAKNLPAMQDTQVQIPWDRKIPWRRKWHPTPVLLPGEFHGQRSWQAAVHGIARVRHDLATKTHKLNLNISLWKHY